MAEDPLNSNHLFAHVQDAPYFDVPRGISPHGDGRVYLPQPLAKPLVSADGKPVLDAHGNPQYEPLWQIHTSSPLINQIVQPLDLTLTKFMVLEVAVALIICALFLGLAARMKRSLRQDGAPKGHLWNMLEAFLIYLRDQVALPCIGAHDVDRFVPLVWTVFFFVLGCNLMGLLPWMGSPTASLAVTAALALDDFLRRRRLRHVPAGRGRVLEGPSTSHGSAEASRGIVGANDFCHRDFRPADQALRAWPCVFWRT